MALTSLAQLGTVLGQSIGMTSLYRVAKREVHRHVDYIAVEEPLEIRLGYDGPLKRTRRSISVTMRTPGHDDELAAGFLFNEGVIRRIDDVASIRTCRRAKSEAERGNVINVELKPGVKFDAERLERHFYATSSCGVCGKASLDAVEMAAGPTLTPGCPVLSPEIIHQLPRALREAQAVFDRTGGLHAAALFDAEGALLRTREDVGRHNAVDKLVGACLLEKRLPLHDRILLVSGRASFELTQKALMASIPVLAAVSAPSSLAVELAQEFGMTLLGFVRGERFNVYSGASRLRMASGKALVETIEQTEQPS